MAREINTAWLANGVIWVMTDKGEMCFVNNRRNTHYLVDTCSGLLKQGYALSEELMLKYQQKIDEMEKRKKSLFDEVEACKNKARSLRKPVVVSSSRYESTAGFGHHYKVALPDGRVEFVTIGISNSTTSSKPGIVNLTGIDNSLIELAIQEYDK